MLTPRQPTLREDESQRTPMLIRWILVAIVITQPVQSYIVFPALRSGYIVDLFILALIFLGTGIILYRRQRLRLPVIFPHALIIIGSLLGTMGGLNRGEAISTLINDIYVWVFFYVAINLIDGRDFIHKLIRIWVVIAILQTCIIVYAVNFTHRPPGSKGGALNFGQSLQQVDATGRVNAPNLSELPSEFIQAKHILKRLQRNSQTAGHFFEPGTGLGTFANGDFTANYMGAAIFMALGAPFRRRKWLLRITSALIITYGCLLTGVSSQVPVLPVSLGVFLCLLGQPRERLFYIASGLAGAALIAYLYVGTSYVIGADLFESLGEAESQTLTGGVAGISGGLTDRLKLVSEGWGEFRQHPLGLGPHGMRSSGVEKNVHNEYLAYLYERGFIGLLGLLLLHGLIFARALWSFANGDQEHKVVIAGLIAAYSLVVINDIAHELLRQRDVWMLAALVVGYSDLTLREDPVVRKERLASQFPWAYPRPDVPAAI